MSAFQTRIFDLSQKVLKCAKTNDSKLNETYATFYEEGCQNPCLARVIFNYVVDKSNQENVFETTKAGVLIQQAEDVEPVKEALHKYALSFYQDTIKVKTKLADGNIVIEELPRYPKSEWIRRFSLDTRRIVLDRVKGKAGWFHKFKVGQFMKRYGIKTFFKG